MTFAEPWATYIRREEAVHTASLPVNRFKATFGRVKRVIHKTAFQIVVGHMKIFVKGLKTHL
jgi:hypothetical protein